MSAVPVNSKRLGLVAAVGAVAGVVLDTVSIASARWPFVRCPTTDVYPTCTAQALWDIALMTLAALAVGMLALRIMRVRRFILVPVFALPISVWLTGLLALISFGAPELLSLLAWALAMAAAYVIAYALFETVERGLPKRVLYVTLGLVAAFVLPNALHGI